MLYFEENYTNNAYRTLQWQYLADKLHRERFWGFKSGDFSIEKSHGPWSLKNSLTINIENKWSLHNR